MALKKERFLVGQPKTAPSASRSKINSTMGKLTKGGKANAGPSAMTPRKGTGRRVRSTPMNVYTMDTPLP